MTSPSGFDIRDDTRVIGEVKRIQEPAPLISPHYLYLPIELLIPGADSPLHPNVEALIDTGFDGDIALPMAWITSERPPAGYTRWRLADGTRVMTPYYEGRLTLGQLGSFEATVIALGDEPIIGRGVIERFRVTLDRDRRVIVRR